MKVELKRGQLVLARNKKNKEWVKGEYILMDDLFFVSHKVKVGEDEQWFDECVPEEI